MNLHALVSGAIGVVNPHVTAKVLRSTGYVTLPDGSRKPTRDEFEIVCQAQPLTFSDLQKLEGLNIQGIKRALYVPTRMIEGTLRDAGRGGDLIEFQPGVMAEGTTWQVTLVLEAWPDWRKLAVTLQNGG